MIAIENLCLRRGSDVLFDDAQLQIHPGEHIGVIGRNGCGKSSLFALLQGELEADLGDLNIPNDWQIACMAQELAASEQIAIEHVIDGDQRLRTVQQQLAAAQASGDDEVLARLHGELDNLQAWQAEAKAAKLLSGLGFKATDGQRPVNDFSGGWHMRLNLARALMCPSDLLLLDEPTNHLDVDAVSWLERWLQSYTGTLLLISHDRDFLDAVCKRVLSFEHQQLVVYQGNYSSAEQQKAQRQMQQQAAAAKNQARVEEIERFVSRFRAQANKAKQAQSRLKELARLPEIEAEHNDSPFRFKLPYSEKTSDPLVHIRQAQLGYGDKVILADVSLDIRPGQRIAVLGRNGEGKSTLLKSLAGSLTLLQGDRTAGQHLKIGYFAQHQLQALDLQASPLLQLQRLSPRASVQECRNFLGGFGFGEQAETESIAHFSGGEKARLALAILAWQKPNLLILDEPTNHLDIEMRHALTVALQDYPGGVLLVSHDRHLLRNTADELWHVNAGVVKTFRGSLDDYQKQVQADAQTGRLEQTLDQTTDDINVSPSINTENKKQRRQQAAAQRSILAPLTKALRGTEKQLSKATDRLEQLHEQLADQDLYQAENSDVLQALLLEQGQLKRKKDDLEMQWLEQQEAVDLATVNNEL